MGHLHCTEASLVSSPIPERSQDVELWAQVSGLTWQQGSPPPGTWSWGWHRASFLTSENVTTHRLLHSYSPVSVHKTYYIYIMTACGCGHTYQVRTETSLQQMRENAGFFFNSLGSSPFFSPQLIWCCLFDSMFNIGLVHEGAISLRSSPLPAINKYYSRLSYNFWETIFKSPAMCNGHIVDIVRVYRVCQSTIVEPCKFQISNNGGNNCMLKRLILITRIENNFQSLKTHLNFN